MYKRQGLNQPIKSEGLLGSGTFEGCLLGEVDLNGTRAVRPTVKGTASIPVSYTHLNPPPYLQI